MAPVSQLDGRQVVKQDIKFTFVGPRLPVSTDRYKNNIFDCLIEENANMYFSSWIPQVLHLS